MFRFLQLHSEHKLCDMVVIQKLMDHLQMAQGPREKNKFLENGAPILSYTAIDKEEWFWPKKHKVTYSIRYEEWRCLFW